MNKNSKTVDWGLLSKYRNHIYGFSILWIILFHAWEAFSKNISLKWSLMEVIRRGNIGVDIFLLLSGISLFFSMKNNSEISISDFYRKRLRKIIKMYLIVCIPYFSLMFFLGNYDLATFIKMLFFMNKNVNSFWFLLSISICYLTYPFIYRCLNEKQTLIYIFIFVYTLILFIFSYSHHDAYLYYEILLSRFPIFLIGSLLGPKVYYNVKVSSKLIIYSIVSLFSLGPIMTIFSKVSLLKKGYIIISRYMMGIQAISFVLIFIIIIQYIDGLLLVKKISVLGKYTLEVYIAQIVVRGIILKVFSTYVISSIDIMFFFLLYPLLSILFGLFLSKLIY